MTTRRHLGFVAAGATLAAAFPLSLIFEHWTWQFYSIMLVAIIAGAAAGARSLRLRPTLQMLTMIIALILGLTWLFADDTAFVGLLPSPGTFTHFGDLLSLAGTEMATNSVPVADLPGLLFLCVSGVGLVAVITDALTVILRRPALAGLPMLAIYSVPVAVYTEPISPLPFVVGAAGFLWLLMSDSVDRVRRFGRRFTGDGHDVDVWEPSPLAAAGRRLALVGVVVALLVPVTLPTFGGGLFGENGIGGPGTGTGGGRTVGGPGSVNLFADLAGRLNQTEVQDLVRVSTTDPSPYYLRFGVADDLTESGFRTRTPTGQILGPGSTLSNPLDRPAPEGVDRQQYRARVEVTKNFDMPMLPVFTEPITTSRVDSSWAYDANMGIIFSVRSRSAGKNYEFEYVRSTYSPQALNSVPALEPDNQLRVYYGKPPLVPEVKAQVDALIRDDMTQYEKVRAIYDFFSSKNNFRYDTKTQQGTSGSKIADFLKNRVGFCEQYAAAMAWLVRSADIPARVAFGFTRGNNFTSDGTYTLTNRNLHAWTEVYFAGLGWIPFDATPSSSVAGSVNPPWAPDPNAPPPSANPSGPDASAGPGGTDDETAPRGQRDPDLEIGGGEGTQPAATWPWYLLGGLVLLLVLMALPAAWRSLLRRRRTTSVAEISESTQAPSLGPNGAPEPPGVQIVVGSDDVALANYRRRAHAAWDELMDTLVDFRVLVDPSDTPRVVATRLVEEQLLDDGAAAGARLLAFAEERARYARTPLAPVGLSGALTSVRRNLREQATGQARLVALLAPPSVVQRWRTAIVNAVTGTITATGRLRDRLFRRISPRRLLAR